MQEINTIMLSNDVDLKHEPVHNNIHDELGKKNIRGD